MINPYENVNWNNVKMVQSLSHSHSHSQSSNVAFESIRSWYEDGIRHFPYSNYYPSNPSYPISDDPYWSRGVQEDYDLLDNWITTNGIDDIIEGPNAEHHTILNDFGKTMSRLHMNGLGSFFSSGNPPNVEPVGANISWKNLIKNIIQNLQFSDGGGITINHPTWTNEATVPPLSDKVVFDMLDYDSRVLGIEIFCDGVYDLALFDRILATGRRCWGFCSPDHNYPGYTSTHESAGRNMLLIPNNVSANDLEHECMKAYREGRFFGKLKGKHPTISNDPGLIFDNIVYNQSNGNLTISAPYADEITIVTNAAQQTVSGSAATITVPNDAIYVRVQASGLGDMVFSNPIIIKSKQNRNMDHDLIQFFMD